LGRELINTLQREGRTSLWYAADFDLPKHHRDFEILELT